MVLLTVSILTGLLSVTVALWTFLGLKKIKGRTERMAEIAGYIAIGVRAYLSRQLKTILMITPLIALVVYAFNGLAVAVTFILGVVTSLTTAFLGMGAAVRANVRTAEDATESPLRAFHTSVYGGSVMGFSVIGFSLVVLSVLYYLLRNPEVLVGFGFGASLAAFFAQIGGGIYTKSADVGADLVGKIEQRIPEDDPRNPAVIADLVGDNVGDCAGRGSDLFQTFSDDIVTGMLFAAATTERYGPLVIFFPLLLQCVGVISSIAGVLSIRAFRSAKPESAFNAGMLVNTTLATVGSFIVSKLLLNDLSIFLSAFLGILVTLVAAFFTRYYAGSGGKPVQKIAEASKRGVALNIITGLAYGLQSPLASIVMIVVAVSVAYLVSGAVASSLLAVVAVNIGTDLLIGFIMTADAFGPITDNAAGIAEMSGASDAVVSSLSALDSVGNTMKATTKAYAMSSGTVTSFVLFATFFSLVRITTVEISSPLNVAFLFLGIALPYLISSLTIGSTAKTALQMVDEVRRQFNSIPGIMEGKAKPDYAACVDIATRNALREMILPGVVSIAVPVAVGSLFGAQALGMLLIGAVASAALLGPFFNNTGTAFDNAKKLIENAGRKGTFEHQAAVAADTIGDPMKDVAGPSLLIFMKLIGMAALLIAGTIAL
ncbi:MAG: sodium-translocating pyrophosphatase [Candidatus Fermentithermobacillus carboniphilus]|uniref:K(+)-insensitive pyrophosphate-energized proton pump n=1 Tax=Candidatus Fermentithermobacillus carboniphilus TaxID=3085328 RepID=A0AAT9LEL1_9FIRM|nr:MAG: sodium-translocating pyrophosphatase [Candidatus Fermentithermobacillus carboniphilus]